MDGGDWQEAASRLELALATIDENRMYEYVYSIPAFVGAARLSLHHSDLNGTSRQLTQAMGALPSVTFLLPFVAVGLRLQLARVYLALADMATARQLLREIDDILRHRPALGTLTGEVEEFRGLISGATGRPPLTPAELRLLPTCKPTSPPTGSPSRLFVSS